MQSNNTEPLNIYLLTTSFRLNPKSFPDHLWRHLPIQAISLFFPLTLFILGHGSLVYTSWSAKPKSWERQTA